MKSFLKVVLGTITGIFLFILIFFLIGGTVATTMAKKKKVDVKANSVLKVDFSNPIGERTVSDPFEKLTGGPDAGETLGLNEITRALKEAKEDDNIKGISLNLSSVQAGFATLSSVKEALEDFKSSGKFIVAYGEMFTQGAYYVGTAADEIYLNPSGTMILNGFGVELMFFKNMLDRLEVEPQIFYVGKYKSATEPLRYEKMSDENREQIEFLLEDIDNNFVSDVAEARGLSVAEVNSIIDELKVQTPEDALEHKIIDGLKYKDEVVALIREHLGLESDDKVNVVSLGQYIGNLDDEKGFKSDKIAVVYAEGGIEGGKGEERSIGSEKYRKILKKIREDEKIKAVVLRVNSGGGSALASDVIWRETQLLQEAGKPVIASMGDVAASGGYFISAGADKILAEKNTITGSIGVFGILPKVDKFFKNKLGITFDQAKTSPYGDFPLSGLVTKEMNETEKSVIQNFVDKIYDQFLDRVAEGRDMDRDAVHEVAQGRVWTGTQALERGLVDQIGGVADAIELAAELAEVDEYKIKEYPTKEDPVQKIIKKITGQEQQSWYAQLPQSMRPLAKELHKVQNILEGDDFCQMIMPYELKMR